MQGLSAPDTIKGRVQRAALEILLEHEATGALPTSIRFVYYEMKQRGLDMGYDGGKTREGEDPLRPDRHVIEAITHLRKAGIVPWEWITDETRSVTRPGYAATILEGLRAANERQRIDLWAGNTPPVIVCEARTLVGVLRPTATHYLCPITSTNGQAGGFLHTDIVPLLDEGSAVLYFGDHNPAGSDIERNTRRVLEREVGPLDWGRVAITPEQAEEADPPIPFKPGIDGRTGLPYESYECEALGQGHLIDLLAGTLDVLLPEPLADVLAREEEQRVEARGRLA